MCIEYNNTTKQNKIIPNAINYLLITDRASKGSLTFTKLLLNKQPLNLIISLLTLNSFSWHFPKKTENIPKYIQVPQNPEPKLPVHSSPIRPSKQGSLETLFALVKTKWKHSDRRHNDATATSPGHGGQNKFNSMFYGVTMKKGLGIISYKLDNVTVFAQDWYSYRQDYLLD